MEGEISSLAASVVDPLEEALIRRRMNLALFNHAQEVVFAGYEVTRRLGAGAQGSVYLARDGAGGDVALKIVRSHFPNGPEAARLQREARALSQLEHPHIVRVLDLGSFDGGFYMVTEYVTGRRLDRSCPPGAAWGEALPLFLGLARGLQAVHELGLVHRDVKPANILVRTDGSPCLIDFGLVGRDRGRAPLKTGALLGPTLTNTGASLGTPRYMAPEVARGLPASAASDQFALCICLWEALFHEPPWRIHADHVLPGQHQLSVPRPPKGATVPRALVSLLRRGLAVDPSERFTDMKELAAALGSEMNVSTPRWARFLRGRHRRPLDS